MTTPADLIRDGGRADPGRPFVTFYDDATGERVELSYATFENWAAKTANMVVEDLAARPGERVALLLPTHWQTVVWYAACWAAGVVAAPGADPAGADHAVADPAGLAAALACPGEKVLVPMRPFGAAAADVPPGVYDYAAEVPAYGDRFVPYAPVTPALAALERDGATLTGAEVVAAAREAAARWGLGPGDRVLAAVDLGTAEGLLAGVLAPAAAGASVVLCRNLDPAALDRRVATEKVTHRLP